MVMCKTAELQKKAAGVKKIAGQSVEDSVGSYIEGIKGVIYGVSAAVTEKELRERIRGGQVKEVKRFKARSVLCCGESMEVLIELDGVTPFTD